PHLPNRALPAGWEHWHRPSAVGSRIHRLRRHIFYRISGDYKPHTFAGRFLPLGPDRNILSLVSRCDLPSAGFQQIFSMKLRQRNLKEREIGMSWHRRRDGTQRLSVRRVLPDFLIRCWSLYQELSLFYVGICRGHCLLSVAVL